MSKIQLRGHCPVCGNQQAANPLMSKHGYTVKGGWFQGVCSGHHYLPIEQSLDGVNETVASIAKGIEVMQKHIAKCESGAYHPEEIKTNRTEMVDGKRVPVMKSWENCSDYEKERSIESIIWANKSRIQAGEDHISMLGKLAQKVFGMPLIEVKREDAPVYISHGEKRVLPNGCVATVTGKRGSRIDFRFEREDGRAYNTHTSPAAWRKYELVKN